MRNQFKSAVAVVVSLTLVLAVIGPLFALVLGSDARTIMLAVWAAVFGVWLLGVLGALTWHLNRRLSRTLQTLRRDIAAKSNRDVIAEVRDTRVKQSRHEFKQELLLERIDSTATTLLGDVDSYRADEVVPTLEPIPWHGDSPAGPKILFITSNGSGMGHLSRCLAVAAEAERQGCRTAVLTLSTAYEVVRQSGYPVMYHPSSAASPWTMSTWNRSFARFLQTRLNEDRPDLVVFDGTAVYRGVTQTCRRLEIPLVWLRRGMWKDTVSRVQYDRPLDVSDFVIVPGEVTGDAPHDQNEVAYVGPISQASQVEILDADTAKQKLGLEREGRYALIQVGSAQLEDRSAVASSIECLNSLGAELIPVVLVSPIADQEPEIPGAVVVHGRYPLAPYLKAFEFGVCSAGYNSVHENLTVGLPAVYIPNTEAVTDDQTARAEFVAKSGFGLIARSTTELNSALRTVASDETRALITDALTARTIADGSHAALVQLLSIIEDTRVDKLHPGG